MSKRDLQSLHFTFNSLYKRYVCCYLLSANVSCRASDIIKKRLLKIESKCDILFVN